MAEEVYTATGRRKSSVARVRLLAGSGDSGKIIINNRPVEEYFPRETVKAVVTQPLELTKTADRFCVKANVNGGGMSGQAGAIRHGISRALVSVDPDLRSVLKKAGLLTRDPRMKERKKYGQKGARKRFQFSKR